MIKTATEGYVTAKIDLLGMFTPKCVATGQKRTRGDEVEAEFICIEPGTNTEKIWLTKKDLR